MMGSLVKYVALQRATNDHS